MINGVAGAAQDIGKFAIDAVNGISDGIEKVFNPVLNWFGVKDKPVNLARLANPTSSSVKPLDFRLESLSSLMDRVAGEYVMHKNFQIIKCNCRCRKPFESLASQFEELGGLFRLNQTGLIPLPGPDKVEICNDLPLKLVDNLAASFKLTLQISIAIVILFILVVVSFQVSI